MAAYYYQIPAGGRVQDVSVGAGTPSIAADTISVIFNKTVEINRNDVIMALEQIKMAILENTFPPV
ncbi:hypothetical protein [Novosphingobium sp. FSW06-99]|uniref:hypothetical protein n=1 Tax=Novosphingobium sp. FSW06-99 TaxID=1739113 RepID=UPI00076D2C17|nr:hypothetical protein [Novosphingobium sp. FSW06-99]KUR80911.1 hypothetical protein AQZ49_02490 [Novosphingobium sp. FSW06-99]